MKKFNVSARVTISIYTVVEAEDEEQAKSIADERGMCSMGDPHSYGDKPEKVWCHSGEIDGVACDLFAEEVK